MSLPETTTPEELADRMGWSQRRVRTLARKLGACLVLGNRMILTEADVATILEACRPCPLSSKSAVKSGIIPAPLPGGDYAAQLRLRSARKRNGPAEFEEALELLVDGYAHKDQILKGTGGSGTGKKPGEGGLPNNGADLSKLSPVERINAARAAGAH